MNYALLNQLDYSSESFRSQFLVNFYSLLKEESLSLEQAEMLLKILQQTKDFSDTPKQKNFQTLENQLNELIKLVKASELTELTAHYLIVLKKPVAVDFQKKWRSEFFKVKTLKIEFNRTLEVENHPLVQGECEQAEVHPSLQTAKWQIESETRCGFIEHLSAAQTSTAEFMGEHKNALITTGLVLVGAAIFLNQYEVKLNF